LLCPLLAGQPAAFAAIPFSTSASSPISGSDLPDQPATALPKPARLAKLTNDERVLHMLNRFTFGPTPEDIAAVHKMGMEAWFAQQLHPATLPDAKLNARLADFPALALPVDQMVNRFPTGAEIRQAAAGKRPIPYEPQLASIYLRHIALYDEKQKQKAEEKSATATPATAPTATQTGETMGKPAAKPPESVPVPAPASESNRPTYLDLLTQTVLAMPPAERITRVLAMTTSEYGDFRKGLKGPQKLALTQGMTPAQKELLSDFDNPTRTIVLELQSQRLLRDIYSTHQLQEVMTTFWLNHFNVFLHKNEEMPYYLARYEQDTIRPRALGNFEDLLVATAFSPAMLLYLDNSSSTGPHSVKAEKDEAANFGKPNKPVTGLNENYARELMELHTLGVDGGYTQKDITEVAKVLSGWSVETNFRKPNAGKTQFDPNRHEPGTKLVLGHKIKEAGPKEAFELLHILATSPKTAHFISKELASTFVQDDPPPALVDRMAATFLKTHGDIPSVLRAMAHSAEFWSPEAYQAKVKTPLEFVVSAARLSHAEIVSPEPLINQLNQMGMPLYACVPPTGYSWKADAWVSTGALVTRMNFALTLAGSKYPGIQTDWNSDSPSSGSPSSTPVPYSANAPDLAEQSLESRLIPTGVSDRTRSAVLSQVQPPSAPVTTALPVVSPKPLSPAAQTVEDDKIKQKWDQQQSQIAGLLLGSPEFQRH
jgi:uncharacterized protein (DUF1800 family)